MAKVSVLVLRAAGINCDYEAVHAFELAGAGRVAHTHINELVVGRSSLSDYDILVLPGGFSYGDDISGGKVLANELHFKLMGDIERFISDGKLILGICNGFQVLIKLGLLPQTHPSTRNQEATLFYNDSGKFECRWVYLRRNPLSPCVFTQDMPERIYTPVAHGEGKIILGSDEMRQRLTSGGHIALQYVNPDGASGEAPSYPWSPNGSAEGIAGLCDATGRIFGLMPHPERFTHPTHHPNWTRERRNSEPDGMYIFKNAVRHAKINL